jgi:hypothetical protein
MAWYACWHKFLIHFIPALCVVINTVLTRGVLIPGHAVYMIIMGVCYMPFNYWGTFAKGAPLYHFMPWKDSMTIVAGFVVFCIAACIQQFFSWLTISVKKRPERVVSSEYDKTKYE